MNRANKTIAVAIVFLVFIGNAGCSVISDPKPGGLDPRLAWPCERLVLTWSAAAARMQSIVGVGLSLRSNDGLGQLRLNVMRCDAPDTSPSGSSSLLYAYVTVPVIAESVSVIVTSVPDDGWFAMPYIFGDGNASALFGRMGYEVLPADISFSIHAATSETEIEAQMVLDNGRVSAFASTLGDFESHDVSNALLVSGADYLSVFFGQERAKRRPSIVSTVQLEGNTPLAEFDLAESSASVIFDTGLRSNRVFWRPPVAK